MVFRGTLVLCGLTLLISAGLINSCKDLGSVPTPPPSITGLTPASDSVGGEIKIVGSNFGGSQGDSYVLFNTVEAINYTRWRDDEIRVLVPGGSPGGQVQVRVVVAGQQSNGVAFQVLLGSGSFGVSQKNVNIVVGDSLVQTISGGTQPYTFVSKGDTTKTNVTISGISLIIRGVAVGSSTVIIGDNSVPQLLDSIHVMVTAPALISYASQIQPIFTQNCAVSGCHVPGGIAPFSFQAGQSYGNIVLVQATASPSGCAGGPYRVQPFSADSSVLYHRISGTSCSSQMLLGRTPLSTSDQTLIRDWINQGAQNN